ncbi:MAG: lysylphosphatidylglycerol synthase transmembrane domain-containing protein [Flavobacteriaceae bacterium]
MPLGIGFLFIYLSISNTTAEDRATIYSSIKDAHYGYILISLVMGLLSHFSRAYRWNFMLHPLGYRPRLINNILAIFITYIANLGVPRSGELFRATVMQTYEGIPFEKSFGTIIAERAIDLLMLLLTIGLALSLESDMIYSLLEEKAIDPWSLAAVLLIGGGAFYFIFQQIKKTQHPVAVKIIALFNGLSEGFLTIVRMEKKWAYLFHTLFIWVMYIAMFYMIKFSLPETYSLGFEPLLIGFIVGALAISATNGGIGIYPFSVSLVLISYGISKEASLAFGWIMWTAQTVMVLLFGSISFLLLPLVNQKK